MATPLSASRFVSALKAEGVRVREYRNWRSHSRNHKGAWGPVNGVMIHHTVSSGTSGSVALCYNGHSSLPGPLCHSVGAKDGSVYMVGNGRANHAGLGDDDVLRDVIAERGLSGDNEANTDGNARFYGLEIVNLGNGRDVYPAAQYDAAVRWAAAICRAHDWSAKSVIGHKEWQPGKIDPHGPVQGRGSFDMDEFRRDVQKRLDGKAGSSAPGKNDDAEDDGMSYDEMWRKDGKMKSAWGTKDNPTWMPESVIERTAEGVKDLEDRMPAIEAALVDLSAKVDALSAKVAALDLSGLVSALESVRIRLDVTE